MLLRPDSGVRRRTVTELASALRGALAGRGERTLILTAGAGSGKTYLLRQLAHDLNVPTRWATGDERTIRHPFGLLAAQLDVELPWPVPANAQELLLARVDELCARGPLLLVVDDAHHADASTLEVLNVLTGAARSLPLALLVGCRSVPVRPQMIKLGARPAARSWTLPAMDSADLEMLAHSRLGAWPDPLLLDRLVSTGGNPLHATTLMNELRRSGAITVAGDTASVQSGGDDAPERSLETVVHEHLSRIDGPARTLLQKLAVWGSAATLNEIAAIDGSNPASLLEPVQTALDAGVVTLSDDGALAFAHDLYAEITYSDLAPALRTLLHTAIAESTGDAQSAAHHLVAADAPGALDAVRTAQVELTGAPAVAVDLLDNAVARSTGGASAADELAMSRAWALAHSGQLHRATQVAEAMLATSTDANTIAALRQVLIFALMTQGHSERLLELIDSTLSLAIDDGSRASLLDFRAWVTLLGGKESVEIESSIEVSRATSQVGLLAESLRQMLVGNGPAGVEIALFATDPTVVDAAESNSAADLMAPFIETYTRGADAAEELMVEVALRSDDSASRWADPFRHNIAGSIDLARGRLDDAAAHYDTGLDIVDAAELERPSHVVGPRAVIDVHKGRLSSAAELLDQWDNSGMTDLFGMALTDHAKVMLWEAQGNLSEAAEHARTTWERLTAQHRVAMARTFAADFARVAVRAADSDLVRVIRVDLEAFEYPVTPAAAPSVTLADAVTGDQSDMEVMAATAAEQARALGNLVLEACAWEEAACAAASFGEKTVAREYARNALAIADAIGATTIGRRVTSRLRAVGVRLGATGARRRPRTGWDSLTPTELRITELIASGLSGTEVARQLYISPRTVQTHVSHAINKVGVRTRVELAMMANSR